MSISPLVRKRVSPEESRGAALAAARELLKSDGAAAVTLQAVAKRVGRTHANLLHHFGTAAGLQRALAEDIAQTVAASIEGVIQQRREGVGVAVVVPGQPVDQVGADVDPRHVVAEPLERVLHLGGRAQ